VVDHESEAHQHGVQYLFGLAGVCAEPRQVRDGLALAGDNGLAFGNMPNCHGEGGVGRRHGYMLGERPRRLARMPRGPKGEKRPADVIGNAVHVIRIATGRLRSSLRASVAERAACSGAQFRCIVLVLDSRSGGTRRRERIIHPVAAEASQQTPEHVRDSSHRIAWKQREDISMQMLALVARGFGALARTTDEAGNQAAC
jgi:hypothetical protein